MGVGSIRKDGRRGSIRMDRILMNHAIEGQLYKGIIGK